jgi:hypothetical protein
MGAPGAQAPIGGSGHPGEAVAPLANTPKVLAATPQGCSGAGSAIARFR